MKRREDNQNSFKLGSEFKTLFLFEKIGFLLIVLSGLLPFIHSFIPNEPLEEKIFGFSSIHTFAYSFGVHFATFILVVGVLFTTAVVNNKNRYILVQRSLRYSLLSPFISGVFYMSWIFIPDVNYNILAYIFLGFIITFLSFIVLRKILIYIDSLKLISEHKEKVLNDGMNYLKTKLSKTNS